MVYFLLHWKVEVEPLKPLKVKYHLKKKWGKTPDTVVAYEDFIANKTELQPTQRFPSVFLLKTPQAAPSLNSNLWHQHFQSIQDVFAETISVTQSPQLRE